MSFKTKIACAVMAAAIAVTATGCSQNAANTKTIGTYNGEEIPVGIYLYGMTTAIENATLGMEDKDADVLTTVIADDMKGEDWIAKEAKNFLFDYIATENMFDDFGYELASAKKDQVSESIDMQKSYYPEFFEHMAKMGIAESSYKSIMTNVQKIDDMFLKYYGKDGVEPVSEDELKKQFELNYRRAILIPVSLKDEAGIPFPDEKKKEYTEKADEYFERLKNGESVESVTLDYMAFSQDRELTEEEKNTDEKVTSSLLDINSPSIPEGFKEVFDAAEEGEFVKVANDEMVLIAKKASLYENPEDFVNMQSTLITQLKKDDFNAVIDEKVKEVEANFVFNEDSLNRYNVKDFFKKSSK